MSGLSSASDGVRTLTPVVVIVGAGPSGLRAAAELAPHVQGDVLVLERETVAGGIPRHSDHLGYGIRDLGLCVSGPRYARMLCERAVAAGARILTNATATDWAGPTALDVTSPDGRFRVEAQAVVLATGARERSRAARLIPGARAAGVYTTGQLQNIVHLKHGRVGRRAVVVGAESVSWSAVLTLRHAGCATVLMTTEYPRPESYWFFHRPGRLLLRTPVATRTRVVGILGQDTVTGVSVEDLDTGQRQCVDCDTVILTGDWIPDNELARATGIPMNPANKAPLVDSALRTSNPGVFAIGNLVHPVDTADVAALDGVAVTRSVREYLAGHCTVPPTGNATVDVYAEPPLRWIVPSTLVSGGPMPPRGKLLALSDRFIALPTVSVYQNGCEIAHRRVPWPAAPGRIFRIPAHTLDAIDWNGGPVYISVRP